MHLFKLFTNYTVQAAIVSHCTCENVFYGWGGWHVDDGAAVSGEEFEGSVLVKGECVGGKEER